VQERSPLEALLADAQYAQAHGNTAVAVQLMQQACALAPGNPQVHKQLASLLATSKRWKDSLEQFDIGLRLDPADGHGWYLAGLALLNAHRFPQAVSALARSLRLLEPNDRVNAAFAEALFNGGLPDVALAWWRSYAATHMHDDAIQLKLGELLSRNGLHQEALRHFRALDESSETRATSKHVAIAQCCEDLGDRSAATDAYMKALLARPGWAVALAGILQLQQAKAERHLEAQAARLLDDGQLPDHEAAVLNYALGKVHDARGEYADAMHHWHEANRLRRRVAGEPNPASLQQRVESLVSHTVTWPGDVPVLRPASDEPQLVFIVGMPRSGTTLTERILGSHSLAHGAGELAEMPLLARSLWPELQGHAPGIWDTPLTRESLEAARTAYLRAIRRGIDPGKRVLIDKAPLNFFNLWLVAALFPNAKVIWCRRDPLDVGVSIYSENFAVDERLCTSLDGIGHYINAQERLMAHWIQTLPLELHTVRYEDLVNEPEAQARALVEFVGLDWEAACLEFYKREDGVQTPSRWQVRQPIHTRSMGRWRHYESQLFPLIDTLIPPASSRTA